MTKPVGQGGPLGWLNRRKNECDENITKCGMKVYEIGGYRVKICLVR
jgi:hypothetical protein